MPLEELPEQPVTRGASVARSGLAAQVRESTDFRVFQRGQHLGFSHLQARAHQAIPNIHARSRGGGSIRRIHKSLGLATNPQNKIESQLYLNRT